MTDVSLKAAILIISETASKDPTTDKSGEALKDTFSKEGGGRWSEPATRIVPDDITEIQRSILSWSDGPDPYNLIVTTGGTGFAIKDDTPEVGRFWCFCTYWSFSVF